MLRAASGIALGYLVRSFFFFATFSLAILTLGADRSFQPGTFEVSEVLAFLLLLLEIGAAIVGGFLCAALSRTKSGPIVLAALILTMGIVRTVLLPPSGDLATPPRPGYVGNFEAMQNASTPPWIEWLLPFVGAAGVLAGAHLRSRTIPRISS